MYLIDTNVLIESHTRYYDHDVCPGFWDWLERKYEEGVVASIDSVREEIGETGWLGSWCKSHSSLFLPENEASVASLLIVIDWLESQASRFSQAERNKFLDGADPYLIAYAYAHQLPLVTLEVGSRDERNPSKVKIPTVCKELGVRVLTPWRMLKAEGATFVIGSDRGLQPQHDLAEGTGDEAT